MSVSDGSLGLRGAGRRRATRSQCRFRPRSAAAFVALLATATPPAVVAQTASIQGFVRDEDGAAVFAASLQVRRAGSEVSIRTTETDRLGYFLVEDLVAGSYVLNVGRLGFASTDVQVTLRSGERTELEIRIEATAIELEGVSVEAERSRERVRFEEQAGITSAELAGQDIKLIPGFAESDPLRAVEVLPGVISTSDFSAAFNVRGGSADQNLILLDGLPIFNPFHLAGFFSVFNADMLSRVELLAGGFPAEFGGRVSSVLDVESDAGTGDWRFNGGVSLLATRLAVGGGAPESFNEKLGLRTTRWRVSARRSYFDKVLEPTFNFPYHLSDLQGVVEAWMGGGSRLTVSGYAGDDVVALTELDDDDFPLKVNWDWGNRVIGANWTGPRSDGGSLEVRTGFSRFNTGLEFPDFDDVIFQSRIDLFSNGIDLESRPARHWTVKTGLAADRLVYRNRFASGGAEFAGGANNGWLFGAYAQATWRDQRKWVVETGLRADRWHPADGGAALELAPRLAVKRFVGAGNNTAFKLAVGRYTQFLHSVRDEELPIGIDIWVLSGRRAPHVVSNQVQVGVEGYPAEGWFVSLETYARTFDGVVTNNLADNPNDDEDDLLGGDGVSYGADLFVRKSGPGASGWLAVSLLKAERTFPDFQSGLDPAPDLTYTPIFDRRLDIDLVVRRPLGWGVEGGLRWNLGTGLPYTRAVGSYAYYQPQLIQGGRLQLGGAADDDYAILLGPRNGERYPTYHRLDVSFRKPMRRSWGTLVPYLDVLNVYNRKNVLFYFYEYIQEPATRSGISMFPILPTIGIEVAF